MSLKIRKILPLLVLLGALTARAEDLAQYVDPMIGTSGHGHTFPGATAPFGLVQVSPDTGIQDWDWCSGYHYSDTSIMGFSHTHLSGTGVGDLGNILFVPQVGAIKWEPGTKQDPDSGYRSRFSHKNEKAEAGYYSVKLDNSEILVELTATERAAMHRYTFPKAEKGTLLIDLTHKIFRGGAKFAGELKIENPTTVSGWQNTDGWSPNKTYYFVAEFSQPIVSSEFRAEEKTSGDDESIAGKHIKGAFTFDVKPEQPLLIKVGISATGVEGARKNLTEIGAKTFDEIRAATRGKWNDQLNSIEVDTPSTEQKRIFYTALYHLMIAPSLYNDVDGSYTGADRKVHPNPGFDYYSTMSIWDIFRAAAPLYTFIEPERVPDFLKTMLTHFEQSPTKQLPIWPLAANETFCMIGYHSVPIIVDAYFKGFRDFDPKKALEAMKVSANSREGHEDYAKKGYISSGGHDRQGVSTTLEYAYDDWCIAQFAKAIGDEKTAEEYTKRSQNYRNVFDPNGFARGHTEEGKWMEPFDPVRVTNEVYTEGNSWQWSWSVMHDVPGLVEVMGGRDVFINKLDKMWVTEGEMNPDKLDVTGLIGQYAQGNEPSHHIAYLYDYVGEPWKTQKWVREIISTMYSDKPDGLSGNEDCGQMSAWYIFNAMGFYPVNPASGIYMIGSPLFPKVSMNMVRDGKKATFTVESENSSAENIYIQSATLNGKPLDRTWITYREIAAGGTLKFVMGPKPNTSWGVKEQPPVSGY